MPQVKQNNLTTLTSPEMNESLIIFKDSLLGEISEDTYTIISGYVYKGNELVDTLPVADKHGLKFYARGLRTSGGTVKVLIASDIGLACTRFTASEWPQQLDSFLNKAREREYTLIETSSDSHPPGCEVFYRNY